MGGLTMGIPVEVRDESSERRASRRLEFWTSNNQPRKQKDEAALIRNSVQVQWTTNVFLSGPSIFIVPFCFQYQIINTVLESSEKHKFLRKSVRRRSFWSEFDSTMALASSSSASAITGSSFSRSISASEPKGTFNFFFFVTQCLCFYGLIMIACGEACWWMENKFFFMFN